MILPDTSRPSTPASSSLSIAVDVVRLAREELMNRGLDGDGRWIGFAKVDEALRT